jgi:hypothetical protein
MTAQTATAMQPAKAPVPAKQVATYDVFDRIQQTLRETKEDTRKRKTVYPDETM